LLHGKAKRFQVLDDENDRMKGGLSGRSSHRDLSSPGRAVKNEELGKNILRSGK